jgi:hypothetical protein
MDVLVVHPGPHFSVADVHRGLVSGLNANGVRVFDFRFDNYIDLFMGAYMELADGTFRRAFDDPGAITMAGEALLAQLYKTPCETIVYVSGFWLSPHALAVAKKRGHRLVLWATESPYEDDRQLAIAEHMDAVIINDPMNIDAYRQVCGNVQYIPHSYDPALHRPGPGRPEWACDAAFVGTAFVERLEFMAGVDWSGIDLRLGGMWDAKGTDPWLDRLVHPVAECLDNEAAVELYRSAKASWNFYRRTASWEGGSVGWAMGPREVELAATGTFFLRDPRPEGDRVLSMLPTFADPGEFGDLLRWWLSHDDARRDAATAARAAVADRTFANAAARLLAMVESTPKAA